jgi:hypothetical protein
LRDAYGYSRVSRRIGVWQIASAVIALSQPFYPVVQPEELATRAASVFSSKQKATIIRNNLLARAAIR